MKNFRHVKPPLTLYYLYCMNFNCKNSIYNFSGETGIRLTAKNLAATHRCKGCGKPLISAIDVEIKNVLTIDNDRPNYRNN